MTEALEVTFAGCAVLDVAAALSASSQGQCIVLAIAKCIEKEIKRKIEAAQTVLLRAQSFTFKLSKTKVWSVYDLFFCIYFVQKLAKSLVCYFGRCINLFWNLTLREVKFYDIFTSRSICSSIMLKILRFRSNSLIRNASWFYGSFYFFYHKKIAKCWCNLESYDWSQKLRNKDNIIKRIKLITFTCKNTGVCTYVQSYASLT